MSFKKKPRSYSSGSLPFPPTSPPSPRQSQIHYLYNSVCSGRFMKMESITQDMIFWDWRLYPPLPQWGITLNGPLLTSRCARQSFFPVVRVVRGQNIFSIFSLFPELLFFSTKACGGSMGDNLLVSVSVFHCSFSR